MDNKQKVQVSTGEPDKDKMRAFVESEIQRAVNAAKRAEAGTLPNWCETDNSVMKGYLQYAIDQHNDDKDNTPINADDVFSALRWAINDLTAQEAYNYYTKH